jgi:hypothetical protein
MTSPYLKPDYRMPPEPVQFCVPPIGTYILLAENWKFRLFQERRNESLIKNLGYGFKWGQYAEVVCEPIVPKGTTLIVDRIYIKKPYPDFASLTFRCPKLGCPANHKFEKTRFWAKLADVNKMKVFPITPGGKADAKVFDDVFAPFGGLVRELDLS